MSTIYPQLFSFSRNQDISLQQILELNGNNLLDHFHLSLSMVVYQQFTFVIEQLNNGQPSDDTDKWTLTNNARFSANKVYNILACTQPAPAPFSWIWKSCAQLKHKICFWLLIQDRLNTRDLLTRKNFYIDDKACVLCHDNPNEMLNHLFFRCDFSQIFW